MGNFLIDKPLKALFHGLAGNHDLPAAAGALQPEIHADPQYFPGIFATGMRFFHFNNLSNGKVHNNTPFLSLRESRISQFFPNFFVAVPCYLNYNDYNTFLRRMRHGFDLEPFIVPRQTRQWGILKLRV